jgi:predicted transcriptional regulator
MAPGKDKEATIVYLDRDVKAKLRKIAKEEDRSLSWVAATALRIYVQDYVDSAAQ